MNFLEKVIELKAELDRKAITSEQFIEGIHQELRWSEKEMTVLTKLQSENEQLQDELSGKEKDLEDAEYELEQVKEELEDLKKEMDDLVLKDGLE